MQTVGVDVLGIGKDEVQGLGWVGGVVGLEVEDGLREPGGKSVCVCLVCVCLVCVCLVCVCVLSVCIVCVCVLSVCVCA